MCGAQLEVLDGQTVVECDYCGTRQTVPTVDKDEIRALFNRANTLRMNKEFDRAAELYEKIIGRDGGEAEAYWGVILCKYGIEYVEDPSSYKRIPTCHRTLYESVTSDSYYLSAVANADAVQRTVYEAEARAIDIIQRDILAISEREEPYDIFICYKETDELKQRTKDSGIANELYYQLTDEGYKVFYAPVTLRDKAGQNYEPYIFAALSSAKVMLAIGTKPEFFNAVWVKNEWSRFLKMMDSDRTKKLIPCYQDMDAYELPDEFAHLHAQNMSVMGFVRELIRGIKTVIVKEEKRTATVTQTVVSFGDGESTDIEATVRRAFLFLEDEEWKSAVSYAEKALDIAPEYGKAYLVKAMAELRITTVEALKRSIDKAKENRSFIHAAEYDPEVKGYLDEYENRIRREEERKREEAELKRRKAIEGQLEAERLKKEERERKAALLPPIRERQRALDGVFGGNFFVGADGSLVDVCNEKSSDRYDGVSKIRGNYYILEDGTVKRSSRSKYTWLDQVNDWRDIADILDLGEMVIGIKKDGKAISAGGTVALKNAISGWQSIVAVSGHMGYAVGLRGDGTAVAAADPAKGASNDSCRVSEWRDLVKVVSNKKATYGIRADGGVYISTSRVSDKASIDGWSDMIDVIPCESFETDFAVGLRRDGTVALTHKNVIMNRIEGWDGIVSIHTLKKALICVFCDGTVNYTLGVGLEKSSEYSFLEAVKDWGDILTVVASDNTVYGIKNNGEVVSAGRYPTQGLRLFSDASSIDSDRARARAEREKAREKERAEAESAKRIKEAEEAERRKKEEELRAWRRGIKVCQYCSGDFRGVFEKVCKSCGRKKDY